MRNSNEDVVNTKRSSKCRRYQARIEYSTLWQNFRNSSRSEVSSAQNKKERSEKQKMTSKLQKKDEEEEDQERTEIAGQGADEGGLEDGNDRLSLQAYNFPLLLAHCSESTKRKNSTINRNQIDGALI